MLVSPAPALRQACFLALMVLVSFMRLQQPALAQTDPLPSWNDGAVKKSITEFVSRVTADGTPDFVPVPERVATFDNDGTLWCEQPVYFQGAFASDRIKAMVPQHPEWKTTQPFKGLLERDMKAVAASGEKGVLQILAASHSGMTTDEFRTSVLEWLATARHHAQLYRSRHDAVCAWGRRGD